MEVTICAREFEIHVDLFVAPGADARADEIEAHLTAEPLDRYLFSRDEVPTPELVIDLLRRRRLSLATAESCTGGLVAKRLTDVPGSSDVFVGVGRGVLERRQVERCSTFRPACSRHTAPSPPRRRAAMAHGARRRLGADVAVAVTGVAGPGGGTEDKPVGLVCLHVVGPEGEHASQLGLPGDRETIRGRAAAAALHQVPQNRHGAGTDTFHVGR